VNRVPYILPRETLALIGQSCAALENVRVLDYPYLPR
jgi:hypothetical protein